jgi:hypothetical protein
MILGINYMIHTFFKKAEDGRQETEVGRQESGDRSWK